MKPVNSFKLTLLLLLLSLALQGGVNLKNGNFYISYTDIQIAKTRGALEDITRTYNSKSIEIGLFGYGWGTLIESRLYAYPDGSLVVAEHGSGGKTVYLSPFATQDMLDLMIDQLLEVSLAEGSLPNTPNALANKREELQNNQESRHSLWNKYLKKGLVAYQSTLPVGAEWESFERGRERIVKTENGYSRIKSSRIDDFNTEGLLVKIDEKNGDYTLLEYTNSHLAKISNADGTSLVFTTNEDGFITRITSGAKEATFKYDGLDLVYAKDAGGNHYKYVYDEKHNLIKIVYNPVRLKGQAEDAWYISYEPKTSFVAKIIDRNGEETAYTYKKFFKEDGTIDDDHYATTVHKTGYNGQQVTNEYEYYIGVKENGDRFSQQIITTVNGIKTATTYDETCELPINITRGTNTTVFKYNNRCLLTEKLSTYDSVYMRYHPKLEKLTEVKNDQGVFTFEYDTKGNLVYASKNDDTWVKLHYDERSKITKMEQADKTLVFEYDERGKPVKIQMEGAEESGAIHVTYDDYGEITRVDSEDGHSMALKVTQAFQNLLALVKPAGVNLSM